MFRREFMHCMTLAGAGSLALRKTVTYRVEGFTCVTCAVGLEVMLRREKGVTGAEASYPKRIVRIEFDPAVVTEAELKQYIADMGFSVK